MKVAFLLIALLPLMGCGRPAEPSVSVHGIVHGECIDKDTFKFKPCVPSASEYFAGDGTQVITSSAQIASKTPRLGLYKPGEMDTVTEYAPRLNNNLDILDAAMPVDADAVHIAAPSEWGPITCGQNLCFACSNNGHLASFDSGKCVGGWRWGCADKSAILMTSEDGQKHCVRFSR